MSDVWNEFPMEVAAEPAKVYQKVRASEEGIIIKADGQITTEPEEPPDHDDIKSRLRAGTMTINEARRTENLPPADMTDTPDRCCPECKGIGATLIRAGGGITMSSCKECGGKGYHDDELSAEPAEPAKDFLFVAMAKISAASLEDAEDHLYATLCIPGDIGFSINSYAITAEHGDQLRFKEVGRTGDADTPVEIARLFDVPEESLQRGREHDKFVSETLGRWFERIEAKLKDMDYPPNYQPTEAEIADLFRELKNHARTRGRR